MTTADGRGSSTIEATNALPRHDHIFNDDLLMNDQDLEYARSQFPEILHILDYPRMRAKFAEYENEANVARDRVRGLGFTAVFSALLALVAIATQPLWPHVFWTRWVAIFIELGGMFAALIATGGLWLGPWKRRWLESRLMTERIRQWHFQLMLLRGHQIEASGTDPSAVAHFEQERDRWFGDFLQANEGKLDAQLETLISEPSHTVAWLHSPATAYGTKSTMLPLVFAAYGRLRFDHQYSYAVYKLRKSTDRPAWQFLKWPAVRQNAVLSGLASVCFVAALICAGALVYFHTFGTSEQLELYVRAGAIVVALIGAALRTIQEGLGLEQEIERYSDYRGRTSHLRDRFNHATDIQERLHSMAELELAAVDELTGFLRTHHNATFVFQ
jgi:hypothetical protein